MPTTRKNDPRISEIEESIKALTIELYELVKPTKEEEMEALEQMRDACNELWDEPQVVLGDYQICIDALDQREVEAEGATEKEGDDQ